MRSVDSMRSRHRHPKKLDALVSSVLKQSSLPYSHRDLAGCSRGIQLFPLSVPDIWSKWFRAELPRPFCPNSFLLGLLWTFAVVRYEWEWIILIVIMI